MVADRGRTNVIEVGRPAPPFRLPDQDGVERSLADLAGRTVVVYFYPRDETPGCTTQACGIRDRWAEFEATGATVIGISPDDVASHAAFAANHDLPHRLLADPDRQAIDAYGVWGPREKDGVVIDRVIRTTVLIGPDGIVAAVWPRVDPVDHAEAVLATIDRLES